MLLRRAGLTALAGLSCLLHDGLAFVSNFVIEFLVRSYGDFMFNI